jgi:uncharacterized protein (TIGR02246 family)
MQADLQSIRELVDRWHRATAAGEVETILESMTEDCVFLVSGKPPMKGRDSFAKGLRALLQTQRVESRGDIQELVVSGDLAYAWTLLTVRVTPRAGGAATERIGSTLTLFRRQPDGRWLLSRDANLLPSM